MRIVAVVFLALVLAQAGMAHAAVESRELPPQMPRTTRSGAANLYDTWLENGGGRLYWNTLTKPTQIRMAGARFVDPASVPELSMEVGKAKPKARRRGGGKAKKQAASAPNANAAAGQNPATPSAQAATAQNPAAAQNAGKPVPPVQVTKPKPELGTGSKAKEPTVSVPTVSEPTVKTPTVSEPSLPAVRQPRVPEPTVHTSLHPFAPQQPTTPAVASLPVLEPITPLTPDQAAALSARAGASPASGGAEPTGGAGGLVPVGQGDVFSGRAPVTPPNASVQAGSSAATQAAGQPRFN